MIDRTRRPGPLAIVASLAAIAAVLVGVTPYHTLLLALGFAGAYASRVPATGGGGRRISLTPLVAAAAVFLIDNAFWEMVLAAAAGFPIGWAVATQRFGRAGVMARSEAAGFVAFVLTAYGADLIVPSIDGFEHELHLVAVFTGAVAWWVAAAAWSAITSTLSDRVNPLALWRQSLDDWPVYLTQFSSGALLGLAAPRMGWWALPLAAMPYMFSHVALHRLNGTKVTYRQTIRALAKTPEVARLGTPGHSQRTADLAIALSAEMGLPHRLSERVEYAALLHDVGTIALSDPAVLRVGYTQADLSTWGATIVSEAPYLEDVATIIANHHLPYRSPGQERDRSLPRGAHAVKVASAYDLAVEREGLSPLEALETLYQGAAYEYDPAAIAALRRLLERRSLIPMGA